MVSWTASRYNWNWKSVLHPHGDYFISKFTETLCKRGTSVTSASKVNIQTDSITKAAASVLLLTELSFGALGAKDIQSWLAEPRHLDWVPLPPLWYGKVSLPFISCRLRCCTAQSLGSSSWCISQHKVTWNAAAKPFNSCSEQSQRQTHARWPWAPLNRIYVFSVWNSRASVCLWWTSTSQ